MKTLKEVKAEMLSKAKHAPCGAYIVRDDSGAVVACSDSPFPHSFDGGKSWIQAEKSEVQRYMSAAGGWFTEAELPEHSDAFVAERYASEQKAERNARIEDTDDYVRLSDMTVLVQADEPRRALSVEEREAVLLYRSELRDLPESAGFPFVEFPDIPACIALECLEKIEARKERF